MVSNKQMALSEEKKKNKKKVWFRDDATGEAKRDALAPASEIYRGRDQFRQRLGKLIKSKGEVRTTEEGLRQQIDELDSLALKNLATGEVANADQVLGKYRDKRESGPKKIGAQAQKFVKVFADFLGVYSGIVGLVKSGGQQYGELAYETLSILFIVVVNKSGNDSQIAVFLSELQTSFPQLDTLMDVYPSTTLEKSVASVYKEVIVFARGAAEYFTRFSVRLWMAVGKPPSVGVEVTIAAIQGKLAEVTREAMILLHSRGRDIHKGVQKLQTENVKLLETVKSSDVKIVQMQEQNNKLLEELLILKATSDLKTTQEDKERLYKIEAILGVVCPCPEMDLVSSRKYLLETFPFSPNDTEKATHLSSRHPSLRFQQMTETFFMAESIYQDWLASTTSSLLYMTGNTTPEGRRKRGASYSWLSPATVYVAEQLTASTNQDRDLCVYYNCYPAVRPDFNRRHETLALLGSVMRSIINWRPTLVRNHFQYLKQEIEKVKKLHAKGEARKAVIDMVLLLKQLLIDAQKETEEGTIYIILDRLDQCDVKIRYLMDELVHLVAAKECRVKIFVVVDSVYAEGEWDVDSLDSELRAKILHHANWDQKRLPNYERSWSNMRTLVGNAIAGVDAVSV